MTTTTTIHLTPEELKSLISEAVTQAIERTKPNNIMRLKEAAEYIGVSRATMHNYLSSGAIIGERIGPKLWAFRKQDLDEWVSKKGVN